ncbi:hypothetical protein [Chelativorans sp. Marseille-P2723]|nr:hypothetical protein [Chelativorans sp. Marseille-P2723]
MSEFTFFSWFQPWTFHGSYGLATYTTSQRESTVGAVTISQRLCEF